MRIGSPIAKGEHLLLRAMTANQTSGVRAPILNAPTVVKVLLAGTVAVHVIRLVLPADLDWAVVLQIGLIAARDGAFAPASLVPLVGHVFLHADLGHLTINMLFLLAFGSGIARQVGAVRFLLLYFLAGMAGGTAFMLAVPHATSVLMGASGAVSGLLGGLVHVVFRGSGGRRGDARPVLIFVAVWLVVNWLVGVYGGEALGTAGPIAWQAHIGGFLAGVVLYPLLRLSLGRRFRP
jgi:membrane associated rhomboid family serine protease